MPKKKQPVIEEPEEEEVTCPACGKLVGQDVSECPHCGAEFETEETEKVVEKPAARAQPKAAAKEPEAEDVTCPVCGKPVGLDVTECPHCGAEFESEETEEVVEEQPTARAQSKAVVEAPLDDDEMAECPVCGKMVSLDVAACPNCGAEFEEEEVEEVIEVEEKRVPVAPKMGARAAPRMIEAEPEEAEAEAVELEGPTSILDLRVIGIALIALGIIGSQISFMIDWYWTWVPPIGDNLGMFIALPAVVIVVGLLVFLLIKRAAGNGKKVPAQMPGVSLSLFLFGILALIVVMLWSPINKALQSSSAGVGIAFVVMLVVGIAMMFFKMRMSSSATA
jgi:predicted amidophosphoribosyltransferase